MKKITILLLMIGISFLTSADQRTINMVLEKYKAAGGANFSASTGRAMWTKEFNVKGEKRSCVSCHTADLNATGKHVETGKLIKPMSARANSGRYNKEKKIEKWFKRNCKWTLGRECTPQEKGDYLLYLSQN